MLIALNPEQTEMPAELRGRGVSRCEPRVGPSRLYEEDLPIRSDKD